MTPKAASFELFSPGGVRENCTASFDVSHNEVVMGINCTALGERTYTGDDAFHALELFRREVEPAGWRVLCNGARKDAYPSGMCRDMGRGFVLYPIPPEGPPDFKTFDPAGPDQICTVEEQLENWNAWCQQFKAKQAR